MGVRVDMIVDGMLLPIGPDQHLGLKFDLRLRTFFPMATVNV